MLRQWFKQITCKGHEKGIFIVDGECVNACKHCKKPMEVYK